jgi:RimJ/RimL family protein N-acetyltransferase
MSDQEQIKNYFGQPIGRALPGWSARSHPPRTSMRGQYTIVEPLDAAQHARALFAAFMASPDARDWTYLPTEPPVDAQTYQATLAQAQAGDDPLFYTIFDRPGGRPAGIAAFLRIDRTHGVIEVGHINLSPALKQTRAATEAMYLMMRRAFDELGYRRYEWKCDSLNAASRRAALRYGFRFEGVFRNAIVTKGRNRDTAWFSIIDEEWPEQRAAFETWLAADNFDSTGRQRQPLRAAERPISR